MISFSLRFVLKKVLHFHDVVVLLGQKTTHAGRDQGGIHLLRSSQPKTKLANNEITMQITPPRAVYHRKDK